MNNQWVSIAGGADSTAQQYSGYLALPPSGHGPGLVLLQEIWGVNEHIRTVADQYANAGFVVLAPDVFWRQQWRTDLAYSETGTAEALRLMSNADLDLAVTDIGVAVDFLRTLPQVQGGVAVLGFCFGGQLAYRTGATGKGDAIVCYYGGGIARNLRDPLPQQPLLFHHAGKDRLINADDVAAIRTALAGHTDARFFDYVDEDHGFNCWGRPAYSQKAASVAMARTLLFLADALS